MSAVLDNLGAGTPSAVAPAAPASPGQRAWVRFKRNRIGYVSLWLFGGLLLLATIAPALTHLHVEAYWEKAIQGAIILLAVVADGVRGRKAAR